MARGNHVVDMDETPAETHCYGRATLRAKQQANSKVVQMVMNKEQPQSGEPAA